MPQVIGVPKETAAGEKRVATVPEVVEKLIKLGFRVAVESGAGDAAQLQRRRLPRRGRRDRRRRRRALGRRPTSSSRCARPSAEEIALMREGGTLVSFIWPAQNPELHAAARGEEGHRAGDGQRAAHLARAEAGRALLDGQHRRLPRRHRGGASLRPLLHRPDHGRGQGAAGQGVRHRRRRRGPGGDRHRRRAWAPSCAPTTRAPKWPTRSSRMGGEFVAGRLRRKKAPASAATPR